MLVKWTNSELSHATSAVNMINIKNWHNRCARWCNFDNEENIVNLDNNIDDNDDNTNENDVDNTVDSNFDNNLDNNLDEHVDNNIDKNIDENLDTLDHVYNVDNVLCYCWGNLKQYQEMVDKILKTSVT